MRVRVDAALTLDAREVPPKLFERLRRALSFPNPAFLERARRGQYLGTEPEELCFLEARGPELRLPRGAIYVLRQVAGEEGIGITCDDHRRLPETVLGPLPELPLRDYQAAAVEKLAQVTQGTFVMPCGAGKTRAGLGALRRLGTPTLILVHTLDLAEQWLGELRDKLGIEAGFVGDGEERPGPVTVAVVQALARWEPEKLGGLLGQFGLLIMDECHHSPCSTFRQLIDRSPARYRLGLTATPERDDGLTPLLDLFLGPPLEVVTHEALIGAGVLTVPEIRDIETDFTFPYSSPQHYAPLLAAVAEDKARNALIVEAVVREAREGQVCLVLSGRIDHCRRLTEAIRAEGIQAAALTSEVKREERKALLDEARAGRLLVLVATSLADEGLDLPRLSRVFLAFPGRSKSRTTQRLGRVMRPHADKSRAIVFDFSDLRVPILYRQHLERQRHFAAVLGVPAAELRARTRTPQKQAYA